MPSQSNGKDWAADYVPVNERIAAFYKQYPDGSLQSEMFELTESRVVMRAYAYRTPTDERPGVGWSSLEIPGRTPYTRGSEIENCETSAWGRAIAALGFEVKKGVASAEEVRNKSEESQPVRARPQEAPQPRRTAQDVPAASRSTQGPPEGVEPDWERYFTDNPPPSGGLDSRGFFARLEKAGITKTDAGRMAQQLYGVSMLRDLTDEQRAHVAEELKV